MITVGLAGVAWLALLGGVVLGWRLRRQAERETFAPMWRRAVERHDRLAEQLGERTNPEEDA